MDKEKIKRLPVIKQMYQLAALGYGRCKCCGMPWKFCNGHSINVTKYDGYSPICEHCWETLSYDELRAGIDKWLRNVTPFYPHTRGEYLEAFKNEYAKSIKETENEVE
jgi:hypothetical protein